MAGAADRSQTIEFGRFTVISHRRELLADGRPIELGGRAFDTLMVLIDARGTVLGKDELMNRVWPDRVVEENNLQAQISALRKVFGADRDLIRTVAGRGYQFTGEIRKGVTSGAAGPARLTNLPTPQSELIGREAPLRDVTNLVVAHRLVTLTGAGGVGKTRLALEATRHLLPRFLDGAWLAELGPLADADLVPVAVAAALGLSLGSGPVTTDRVAAALRAKHLLLVIDNCEHVIEVAAAMAEAVLKASPLTRVLATSRESLRATEEYAYRVPSLDVPADDNVDGGSSAGGSGSSRRRPWPLVRMSRCRPFRRSWRIWWRSRSSPPTSARPSSTTGSSRRHGSMRVKRSSRVASTTRSPGATASIIEICWIGRRPTRRPCPPTRGRPPTVARSMMSAPRSTGRFRPRAT